MGTFRKYFLLCCFYFLNNTLSQTPQVITISPSFNEIASSNHPAISATFNVSMDSSSFNEISFAVLAERSGYHTGSISYSEITKTVSFNSNEQFNAGERVTVMLSNKIRSQQGDSLNGFSWLFRIPSGIAPVNFSEAVEYGGGGDFMQCVDMNNDNYPDIVTSSGVILLNSGSGEFNESWLINDAIPDFPIIVNDFNRDGFMDIYYSAFESPKIGFGDANGNYNIQLLPYWFFNYISADFNGDGYPDICGIIDVQFTPPDSTVLNWSIAFNDGTGNFNDTIMFSINGGGKPISLINTDLDNDGDQDVAIISHPEVNPYGIFGLNGFIVGNNDGNGVFRTFQYYPDGYFTMSFPYFLYSSDYNNDSFNDVALISSGGGLVALNTGDGTFNNDTSKVRYFWPAELSSPISGSDINGDSWIDIVISGYEWPPELQIPYYSVNLNSSSYFPGFWNNNFADTLPTGNIQALDLAELNRDDRIDIVHCNLQYGIYITFNRDTILAVENSINNIKDFYLTQNYPNPFNSQTVINFGLIESEVVSISVYNILGEEVRLLENKLYQGGKYKIIWDGKSEEGINLPTGPYIIKANSFTKNQIIKVLLIK